MPLTLEKLYSKTLTVEFEFMDDIVHAEWAPARWNGEMDDFAEDLAESEEDADTEAAELDTQAEGLMAAGDVKSAAVAIRKAARVRGKKQRRQREHVRVLLSKLLVSWDVLDGETPLPTDLETLRKLPDSFLQGLFLQIASGNRPDPTKAPNSPDTSSTTESSEPSPTGTSSSGEPTTSESPPGPSTDEPTPSVSTPSGDAGR